MTDIRRSLHSLQSSLQQVVEILSRPDPLIDAIQQVTYIIKKYEYNLDRIIHPLTELMIVTSRSQIDIFKSCIVLMKRVIDITSIYPHLFYAHTFLEISYRMISTICCCGGHVGSLNLLVKRLNTYRNASLIIVDYNSIIKESRYDIKLIRINLDQAIKIINCVLTVSPDVYIPLYKKHCGIRKEVNIIDE